jgi:hypothetical protein
MLNSRVGGNNLQVIEPQATKSSGMEVAPQVLMNSASFRTVPALRDEIRNSAHTEVTAARKFNAESRENQLATTGKKAQG